MQYFYDQQIRRYLTQFMRILGGFSVMTGKDRDGNQNVIQIPVRYGDINRMAAHIIKNQSENMINTVPFISCYVTDLQMAADRRTNPTHINSVQVYEKKLDPVTGTYINDVGNTYTIDRHMPVPYDMTVQVDIWTSNTEQKLQILEQLLVLFNPSINLKLNDNPFDWTNLSYAELVNVVWSVRQVPQGTDDIIDVAALNFGLPIYINPPAKVKRQVLINTILTKLNQLTLDGASIDWNPNNTEPTPQWIVVTFEDLGLQVKIQGQQAQLLSAFGNPTNDNGVKLDWNTVLKPYGELRFGISNIRLRRGTDPSDNSHDIICVIDSVDTANPNILHLTVDPTTLPIVTVNSINAIIDPMRAAPGKNIPVAQRGQRYLVLNNVPVTTEWGRTGARANDIIEYNGSEWVVSFNAAANSNAVVLNTATNLIYEFKSGQWISATEGTYNNGWWRVYL